MTKSTERFAADLAKVCRRARADMRTVERAVFCPPQSAALSMPTSRLFIKLAPLALIASLLGGCTGGCSREQPQPPEESVVKRMEDPVYRSQLESLRAEQNEIADGNLLEFVIIENSLIDPFITSAQHRNTVRLT